MVKGAGRTFIRDDRRWFGRRYDKSGLHWSYLGGNAHRDTIYPGQTGTILVQRPWSTTWVTRDRTLWIVYLWRRRGARNLDTGSPFIQIVGSLVRDLGFYLRVLTSHFDRIDVETVIHSDSGFAAVPYSRIKGAILKGKPESENGPSVSPLLATIFARIQTLLRGGHSVDSLIHGVLELVTRRPTVQPRSLSGSRRSDWVVFGDTFCATGRDITFEKEVAQCFCGLQGSSTSVEKTLV